jgi:hypothetical protein
MPITDSTGLWMPVSSVAGQELSCWALPEAVTRSSSPPQPPTLCRPIQGERQQGGDDHEELQDLVVDRRGQAAERGVGEDDARCSDRRDEERPAQQRVDDVGQQEEVDSGDEHLGDREAERVDQVRTGAEAAAHVLRDAAHLGAVVERHHHHAEEQHGGHGADPEVVHGRQAVLRAVGRHAHDLDRTQVGRDEREAGHPRR